MKANELMIGDWVKVLPISRKTEAHNSQVGALARNVNNTISIEGGYFPAWTGWSVGEEYIVPIPLTAEILEKNGFEKYEMYHTLHERNVRIEYYWHERRLEIQPYGGEPWIKMAGLHYVHELQHAFRLCGLNELAYNFKVE